ncbi:glycosyltransferase family 2 protein [Alkalihalobacillus pseudalcaliphilus]|uniref:glycosyltransferase family 2 protein n=1 Tax=Alkalihalobacillus pseudalcaliphilus TaxID=79884 RepID=UPI00064DA3A3|nr:glycosyltransferase family 2 protein [Alkalihalobacillus pseudalcaliphilus]KMK77006.1 dolichyl-phosphate mannose synthase [Alkalihalobacillus pseudalcaliphilus]
MEMSVIIPAYNEQSRIEQTLQTIKKLPYPIELIVVNDGSTDLTGEIAEKYADILISFTKNQGKGVALRAGCAKANCEWILCLDADLTTSANEAVELIKPALLRKADLIISKVSPGRKAGFGMVKRQAQEIIQSKTGVWMESPLSGQRVFHRDWLPLIQSLKAERFGIETEMNLRFIEAGASILEVETEMSHREMGKSLKGLWHRYKQWLDIVKFRKEV